MSNLYAQYGDAFNKAYPDAVSTLGRKDRSALFDKFVKEQQKQKPTRAVAAASLATYSSGGGSKKRERAEVDEDDMEVMEELPQDLGAEEVDGSYFLQGTKLGKAFALYGKVMRDVQLTDEDNAFMKQRQDEFFDYVNGLLTSGTTLDEFREGQALLGKVMLCALKCEMDIDTANSGISMGVVNSAKSLKDIRTDYRIATNLWLEPWMDAGNQLLGNGNANNSYPDIVYMAYNANDLLIDWDTKLEHLLNSKKEEPL